jgi:hypothetical protein
MGGLGSGERWKKKAIVEGKLTIDTSDFKRQNLLVPNKQFAGSITWSSGSSIKVVLQIGEDAGSLRLIYQFPNDSKTACNYSVPLVASPCHLGGRRWWFLCPMYRNGVGCGCRVRKLYLTDRYFGCRQCHGLTYRSRQESDSRVYAMIRSGLLANSPDVKGWPLTQLGVAMKALTLERKRDERFWKRVEEGRRRRRKRVDPGQR